MSLVSQLTAAFAAVGADVKKLKQNKAVNASIVDQTGFATDTYVTNSNLTIPGTRLQAKTVYRVRFDVVKTGAGVAAPVVTVRFGTNGTTADTARLTFTFAAQTAVADEGVIEIYVILRTVGVSATMQGDAELRHRLVTTGLNVTASSTWQKVLSGTFDSTLASNPIVGVSVNAGTSASWTVKAVVAELLNLN